MNKISPTHFISMALLMAVTFTACKKDSGSSSPPVVLPPAGTPFVDTITVNPVNTPLDVFPVPNNYPDVWMVAVGSKIYFGNGSESGNPVINRFFANYDLTTNTLTKGLATTNSTCNCGANGRLLTDGTSIYSFANTAAKYTPATNTWTVPAYPQSASSKLGEPGTAVVGSKIYHLGGRSAGKAFIYYDAAVDNWFAAPDCPNEVEEPLLIAVDKKVYVFGGGKTPATTYKSFIFDTESNSWQNGTDISPYGYSSSIGYSTASDGKRIFIQKYDFVLVYNIAAGAFRSKALPLGTSISGEVSSRNLFFIGGKLYLAGFNETDNRFVLYELVVKG